MTAANAAGRRLRPAATLLVLAVAELMITLDLSVVNVALPSIRDDLDSATELPELRAGHGDVVLPHAVPARALAMRPILMLFDEATSALDPETVGEVLAVMQELATEGMTMICVTHEMEFAREAADRVVMMDDGMVVEDGAPARLFAQPRHDRTQQFLSKIL